MCAIYHEKKIYTSKENLYIKGCDLLKKIMYDLFFMNYFSEDSSELQKKPVVQFESGPSEGLKIRVCQ
jgi:hypothetical protein